jgi:hypothetical protein
VSLVIAWLAFPAAMTILSWGCGLAVERTAAIKLRGPLLIPTGLAAIITAGSLTTMRDSTAALTAPLVVVLAAAGFALAPPWRESSRLDRWAVGAALAVFAVFAAPVVLSGQATFAGVTKLDDIAEWAAIADRIMAHGVSAHGLVPSAYQLTIQGTVGNGYPVGSLVPLALGSRILNFDPLWLLQPWLSFLAATLALVLDELLRSLITRRRARAICVFVAAQAALLYAYAMWGGVKELATAPAIALVVALVPLTLRRPSVRSVLPLVVAAGAVVEIASLPGAIWLVPALSWVVVHVARGRGLKSTARLAGGLVGAGLVLALPTLADGHVFLDQLIGSRSLLRSTTDIGNLLHPISPFQMLGIWPSTDFREAPHALQAADALIALTAVLAVVGVVAAARRRAWLLVVYGGGTAAVGVTTWAYAGPWVEAKAFAVASPALVALALAGVAFAWGEWRRVPAALAGGTIALGVLWSNALAYHGVALAPRNAFLELDHIGRLAAGKGPTLMTEYNMYGARHFLRAAAAESVSDVRSRPTPLRNGALVAKATSADTDELQLDGLLAYRTLVVRRSPAASRPPAIYRLVWSGRTYEMWQRPVRFTRPLAHLPLGDVVSAAATPRCRDVHDLAVLAGWDGLLASVRRPVPTLLPLGVGAVPDGWRKVTPGLNVVLPTKTGTLHLSITVPSSTSYDLWVPGSVRGKLSVAIDGVRVGAVRHVIAHTGAFVELGSTRLASGRHRVALTYQDGGWRPGSGGQDTTPFTIGPLLLAPMPDPRAVTYTLTGHWRQLCGKTLDWIEALNPHQAQLSRERTGG